MKLDGHLLMFKLRNTMYLVTYLLLTGWSYTAVAGDAAIEIQEGNVENWIKYYERELGIEIAAPIPKSQEADSSDKKTEPGRPSAATPVGPSD